ncbi:MAG: choice-of-anchor D domain-containing protein, partial [bacterium]
VADSTVIFHDNMESGVNGWSHYSTHANGIDQWAQTSNRASSGVTSWQASQHDFEGGDALQSPSIDLTGYQDATLTFMHWHNFDDCEDPTFEPDGGILEVSIDGGSKWTQVFPAGGYPYTLDDVCSNPLAFRDAYSHDGGNGNAFIPAIFDLTPYAGNTILIRWQAGWDCGNCAFNNEGWYVDDVTVYSTSFTGWLAANPDAGTVVAGNSIPITVTFDATGLNGGDYAANLVISSNDPQSATVKIPARLHVTGAPDIALSDNAFDFGSIFVGDTATAKLNVSNLGTDLLTASIVSNNGDYTVTPNLVNLDPKKSRVVSIRFIPSALGEIPGTLTITTNDPDERTITIPLRGRGVPPPEIAVAPDSLGDRLFTGEISKKILTIANSGGSDLTFELSIENINVTIPVSLALKNQAQAGKAADGKIENLGKPAAATISKGARNRDAEWALEILRANERVAAAVSAPITET